MRKILYAITILLLLAGCESNIETKVNLSDLQSKKEKMINGDLYFEVAMCGDMEDSRRPSDFVIEAQKTVPYIFEGAQYVECFEKEMQAYAHFRVPIKLAKQEDHSLSNIYFLTNTQHLLAVGIPYGIREKMKRAQSGSMAIDEVKLKINIELMNDTGKLLKYKIISAYLNGAPVIIGETVLQPMQTIKVKLSNVSTDNALQNGLTAVLVRYNIM